MRMKKARAAVVCSAHLLSICFSRVDAAETYSFANMWPEVRRGWVFREPLGVASDSSGNIYVADSGNALIKKFNSTGHLLVAWGDWGSSDGEFDHPQGMGVGSSGTVFVADRDNNRIQKFDSSGGFLTKWGSDGTGDGEFSLPEDVAVDSSGHVYVADTGNHRMQKFDSMGNFLTTWGSEGTGDEEFNFLRGSLWIH